MVAVAGSPFSSRPAVQAAPASGSHSIYVSPSGNDHNPGTSSKPVQTLFKARSLVRGLDRHMNGDITVYLKSGAYRLGSPLQLGSADSGTGGHNVIWTSAPGQTATISGADHIGGWKLSDRGLNMWSAHVPSNLNTRQIYVNGQRATIASGPAPVHLTRTSSGYTASSSALANWHNPSSIDFVYTAQLGLMVKPICPVGSIHGTIITMAQPCWDNSNLRTHNIVGFGQLGTPSYIENAYQLLRKPGQFYLDGGLVSFITSRARDRT